MSPLVVISPFTSISGAHQVGAQIPAANTTEIAAIEASGDAAFVVYGADPSPTLTVLAALGTMG